MRHLDILNELLLQRRKELKLPDFRCTVNESFGNLAWLRKHIAPKLTPGDQLLSLIQMDEKTLRKIDPTAPVQ